MTTPSQEFRLNYDASRRVPQSGFTTLAFMQRAGPIRKQGVACHYSFIITVLLTVLRLFLFAMGIVQALILLTLYFSL